MLSELKVIELAVWVAGPAACGVMADLGAHVVKVEPPAGDPMRRLFGSLGIDQDVVPPFDLDNRGKQSVVIDLTTDDGRDTMETLLSTADVFVTNLRPDALARLGLAHTDVCEKHPSLVYTSITGYGTTGPDTGRAGYDVGAFWARSGLAASFAPPGTPPADIRPGFGDHITAMAAVAATLAAITDRTTTGRGRHVDVSLLRTGIWTHGWEISVRQWFDKIAPTRTRTEQRSPLINSYRAADRWFWLLGLEQDRHWPTTLAALGRTDLAHDTRFATVGDRARNSTALIEIFDREFEQQPLGVWAQRFDTNGVWWAPVNDVASVLTDPQAVAAGAFTDIEFPDGTLQPTVAQPINTPGLQRPGPPPRLGEHTAQIVETRTGAHQHGSVWTDEFDRIDPDQIRATVRRLERDGCRHLWIPEGLGHEAISLAATLLQNTTTLRVGTGIANVWARDPYATGKAAALLHALHPERFVLGLGVSHQLVVDHVRANTYTRPLAKMTDYLDRLDALDVDLPTIVLAALGPRMTELAAARTSGVITYLALPEHTATTRRHLGKDHTLIAHQVVVDSPADDRRTIAREHLATYLMLDNYRTSFERQGFHADDFEHGGSDRLVDALYTTPDYLDAAVGAHLDAGATRVAVQSLTGTHRPET